MTADAYTFTDADSALLYDIENPWDTDGSTWEGYILQCATLLDAVLDVGCGTGSMLHLAREHGAAGRLVGVDPDEAMLERARAHRHRVVAGERRGDGRRGQFDLATMNSNAFQCFVTDEELRASLRRSGGP